MASNSTDHDLTAYDYIKTNSADGTMLVQSGGTTEYVPIGWFWGALTNTTLFWTALQYLWIWLFYLLISVPECIFWIMYMVEVGEGEVA